MLQLTLNDDMLFSLFLIGFGFAPVLVDGERDVVLLVPVQGVGG